MGAILLKRRMRNRKSWSSFCRRLAAYKTRHMLERSGRSLVESVRSWSRERPLLKYRSFGAYAPPKGAYAPFSSGYSIIFSLLQMLGRWYQSKNLIRNKYLQKSGQKTKLGGIQNRTQKHDKTRNKLKGTRDQDFGTKGRNETQTV